MKTVPFHSPRGCLSYLLIDEESKQAALVDPSQEIDDSVYLDMIAKEGLHLAYLIETHTHADHLSSSPRLKEVTTAKIVRHALAPSPLKDIAVDDDLSLSLGNTTIVVRATPGHTNESISLFADGAVFTGDALLIGGTGRTDFQLGNSEALYTSLHDIFGSLPDETIIYPGHDYRGRTQSTIGTERSQNPRFLLPKEEFIAAMEAHHPPVPELFEESLAANSL